MFAAEIRRRRVSRMRGFRQRKWHLDDIYVKIIGEMHYLWRAVDREGEILEGYVTRTRDKAGARETASRARYFSHRTAAFIAFVTSIRKMRLIEGLPQPNNFSCWQCDPFVIAAGRNATSSIVRLTRPAAQPHWLSGSRLWPDRRWGGERSAKGRRVAVRLTAPRKRQPVWDPTAWLWTLAAPAWLALWHAAGRYSGIRRPHRTAPSSG